MLKRFEHGGDIYTHPGLIDFSASLNPLGMPASAAEAFRACVSACEAYPDPYCRELTQALGAFEGLDEGWVLPCAGATDAITRLCQVLRPERAFVCAPCYRGYEEALEQVGAKVEQVRLSPNDDFAVGPEQVRELVGTQSLSFLANPNNPTGRCLDRAVLISCLERASERGSIIALDECFIELTGRAGSSDLLERYPNLVIIKALTKSFCLAGLRVGYALCSDEALLARMRAAGQPWAVSVPAQLAGAASVQDTAYLRRSVAYVARERARLTEALVAQGLRVVPGEANYLLFKGPRGLDAALAEQGVRIRSCENFCGLDGHWYRIAVRTSEQNARFVTALEEAMACVQSR